MAWLIFGRLGDSWWQLFTADFLRKQVLTSRNVHLFPSMPRPDLRRAQPGQKGLDISHIGR